MQYISSISSAVQPYAAAFASAANTSIVAALSAIKSVGALFAAAAVAHPIITTGVVLVGAGAAYKYRAPMISCFHKIQSAISSKFGSKAAPTAAPAASTAAPAAPAAPKKSSWFGSAAPAEDVK